VEVNWSGARVVKKKAVVKKGTGRKKAAVAAKEKSKLHYMFSGFPHCCGARILHNMATPSMWTYRNDAPREYKKEERRATLAITAPYQKTEAKFLKENGFEPLVKFAGSHGDHLTLWIQGDLKKV
jgi:hypothetical protein